MVSFRKLRGILVVAGVASAAIHEVQVGKGGTHVFDPEEVEAKVGDTIRYFFHPANHSVARAEYKFPCLPIEKTTFEHPASFWSEFKPMKDGQKPLTFDVVVENSTVYGNEPIWVYCSAPAACTGNLNSNPPVPQMVGVVWVNGNKTMLNGDKFSMAEHKAAAAASVREYSPGEDILPESGAPVPPTETPAPIASPSHGLSKGAIAGIAVGAVAAVVLIAVLVYLSGRNKSLSETLRYSRPPAGKIAPLPAMLDGPNSPYPPSSFPSSPAFPGENKTAATMVVPAPGYNNQDNNHTAHQSWMSQSPTMRAQSPDSMAERGYNNGGMMSPNAFSPHNSYLPQHQQQQQQQQGSYQVQSSPSETPWSPGGYNWQNMQQQQHEMGTGQEGIAEERLSQRNNGYPTQSHIGTAPVELAGDTADAVVSAAPPVYRPTLGEDGETAQMPEDKTSAVIGRDD